MILWSVGNCSVDEVQEKKSWLNFCVILHIAKRMKMESIMYYQCGKLVYFMEKWCILREKWNK